MIEITAIDHSKLFYINMEYDPGYNFLYQMNQGISSTVFCLNYDGAEILVILLVKRNAIS